MTLATWIFIGLFATAWACGVMAWCYAAWHMLAMMIIRAQRVSTVADLLPVPLAVFTMWFRGDLPPALLTHRRQVLIGTLVFMCSIGFGWALVGVGHLVTSGQASGG